MITKAQFPKEQTEEGEFQRQPDAFRGWVTADGSSGYPAAAGRYHHYITHDDINPTRIVPLGPIQDLMAPCTERKAL